MPTRWLNMNCFFSQFNEKLDFPILYKNFEWQYDITFENEGIFTELVIFAV